MTTDEVQFLAAQIAAPAFIDSERVQRVVMRANGKSNVSYADFRNEISILTQIGQHNHIVFLLDVLLHKETRAPAMLMFEHFDSCLSARSHPPSVLRALLAQLADAVAHLHSLNVVHLNIQPSAVKTYSNTHWFRLSDFTHAQLTSQRVKRRCSRTAVLPPELQSLGISICPALCASDVWMLAACAVLVCHGDDCSQVALPASIPPPLSHLLAAMLRAQPDDRIEAREVIEFISLLTNQAMFAQDFCEVPLAVSMQQAMLSSGAASLHLAATNTNNDDNTLLGRLPPFVHEAPVCVLPMEEIGRLAAWDYLHQHYGVFEMTSNALQLFCSVAVPCADNNGNDDPAEQVITGVYSAAVSQWRFLSFCRTVMLELPLVARQHVAAFLMHSLRDHVYNLRATLHKMYFKAASLNPPFVARDLLQAVRNIDRLLAFNMRLVKTLYLSHKLPTVSRHPAAVLVEAFNERHKTLPTTISDAVGVFLRNFVPSTFLVFVNPTAC